MRMSLVLKNMCRSCLTSKGHLKELTSTKVPRMLEFCTNVKISECDGLPQYICVPCFRLVTKLYTFKKSVEKNDKVLRSYLRTEEKQKITTSIIDIAFNEAQIEGLSQAVDQNYLAELNANLKAINSPIHKSSECIQQLDLDLFGINPVERLNSEDTSINGNEQGNCLLSQMKNKQTHTENGNQLSTPNILSEPPPLVPILTPLKIGNTSHDSQNICGLGIDLHGIDTRSAIVNPSCSLVCNICRKTFTEKKKLIGHLKRHITCSNYECKICLKKYPNASTFRVHLRTHTGEKPFKCTVCGKCFTRYGNIITHMKTHEPTKAHLCDICGKGFKIACNLERHKILHTGLLPFTCKWCGKKFSQLDNMQIHIRTHHTNERPYLCSECGKSFVSSTRLKRHSWIHSGYKPYICKSCPKAYSNSSDLRNHERMHTNVNSDSFKQYGCSLCGMRFYHACRLTQHMKTHEKPFSCNACSKKFSTNELLNKHFNSKHQTWEVFEEL